MNASGVVAVKRRLNRAEAERLVRSLSRAAFGVKNFEALGLNVFTLDAWRKRITQQSKTEGKIVPVEIIEDDAVLRRGARQTASWGAERTVSDCALSGASDRSRARLCCGRAAATDYGAG